MVLAEVAGVGRTGGKEPNGKVFGVSPYAD